MRSNFLKVSSFTVVGCLGIVLIFGLSALVGGVLWTYSINTWLAFLGKTQTISWYVCALFSLIPHIGYFSIPVSIVTYVLMLFI